MAAPSFSERHLLIPKISFSVRPAVKSDAAAISRINEHIVKYSLRGTRDSAAPVSDVEKGISDKVIPNMVYLVATLGNGGSFDSNPATYGTSPTPNYTVDNVDVVARGHKDSRSLTASFPGNVLGYIMILPYKEDADHLNSCFNRTASLYLFTFEEDVLGEKVYRAVNSTLVDEALARCKERGLRYRTVTAAFVFRQDQETLTTFRDILVEKGFKEVGLLKQVVENHGLLFDRIILQRDI